MCDIAYERLELLSLMAGTLPLCSDGFMKCLLSRVTHMDASCLAYG